MLPPQLRQGGVLRPVTLSLSPRTVQALSATFVVSSPSSHHVREFSWDRRGRCWESHLDPKYQLFLRRRHNKVKGDFKDALRRYMRWDRPAPSSSIWNWGSRNASHWSRSSKRWQQWEEEQQKRAAAQEAGQEYELSEGEKRWKEKMDKMKNYVDADPYRAIFGKPFDPFWAGAMWGPLVPSWIRPENEAATKKSTEGSSEVGQPTPQKDFLPKNSETPNKSPQSKSDASPRIHAQSSSFSMHKTQSPGQKPVIEASASSWDSASNEIRRSKYDPISNRMVPIDVPAVETKDQTIPSPKSGNRASIPTSTSSNATERPSSSTTMIKSTARNVESASSPSYTPAALANLPKNDIDFLTADNVRASMGKVKAFAQEDRKSTQELEHAFGEGYEQLSKQLEEARQGLATRRRASSAAPTSSGPPSSTSQNKPEQPRIIHPALDRLDKGLPLHLLRAQRDVDSELSKLEHKIRLETTDSSQSRFIAFLNRIRQGFEGHKQKAEAFGKMLSQEKADIPVEKREKIMKERMDELKAIKSHMDQLRIQWVSSVNALVKVDESGHSRAPMGLQTSYAREQKSCETGRLETLEQELASQEKQLKSLTQEVDAKRRQAKAYKDHYSQSPLGLQILYQQEHDLAQQGKRPSLEQELKSSRTTGIAHQRLQSEVEAQKTAMRLHEDRYPTKSRTSQSPSGSIAAKQDDHPMQSEGDLCSNVAKFATSDRWYKETPEHRAAGLALQKKVEQARLDKMLVKEIKSIMSENGLSADHEDKDVQRGLAAHDRKLGATAYEFKEDNLEQEIAQRARTPKTINKPQSSATKTSTTKPSSVAWAEPAVYKVLAYDSGNDILRNVTTPAEFYENEGPISIASALSQLYQPARFIPHFASLQSEGYQVISASRDVLVFRKVAAKPASASPSSTIKTLEPRKITTPILSDKAVDVPTGDYASPTGFVNFDKPRPVSPASSTEEAASTSTTQPSPTSSQIEDQDQGIEYRHYPRVRRQEPVFSGQHHHAKNSKYGSWRSGSGRVKKERREGRWRGRVTWALSVGAATAASVYAIGVGAELARGRKIRQAEVEDVRRGPTF